MVTQAAPLVSIIVRTYQGRGPLLEKALSSLAAQTYPSLEVLVIEDGSDTHKERVGHFPFSAGTTFRYFSQAKLGRSAAANLGLENANGKYIGFLDDDDYLNPSHCQTLVNLLEEEPEAAAAYAASMEISATIDPQTMAIRDPRETCVHYIPTVSSAEILFRNLFPIQAVLFRRGILTPQHRFDPNLDAMEDWLFWMRLLLGHKIVSTPEVTSVYHVPLSAKELRKRQDEHKDAEDYFELQRWAMYEELNLRDSGSIMAYCRRSMRAAKKMVQQGATTMEESKPLNLARAQRLYQILERDPVPELKPNASGVVAFTSVNLAYLPKALLWAESIKKYQPDWEIHILLNDAFPARGVNWPNVDVVFPIRGLNIPHFQSWLFGMHVVEVCTATKSFYSCHLLDAGYKHVFYFDPDMQVYGKLDYLMDQFTAADVLLTPHCTEEAVSDAELHFNEMSVLAHGIYNLGFVGFKNTEIGRKAAQFWRRRMTRHCRDDHARGLFTDQKWWNLAPIFFDKVGIIKHPGCNTASWNIAYRPLSKRDGRFYAGDSELLFFHFSGYDRQVPRKMFDIFGQFNDSLRELIAGYDARLGELESQFKDWKEEWALARFDNGKPITDQMRIFYRSRYEHEIIYKDPFFAEARESFYAYIESFHGMRLPSYVPQEYLKRYY